MYYCLSKKELNEILEHFIEKKDLDHILHLRLINAQNWQEELGVLNYLFSQLIIRKVKKKDDDYSFIDFLYNLPSKIYLSIEEFNWQFIQFMMKNKRDKSITLEEELLGIQNKWANYEFDSIIRM